MKQMPKAVPWIILGVLAAGALTAILLIRRRNKKKNPPASSASGDPTGSGDAQQAEQPALSAVPDSSKPTGTAA